MRSCLMIALVFNVLGFSAQPLKQTVPVSVPATQGFVGNREAKIYHLLTCKLVLKIKPENKVSFATKEEAVKAGYAPCKICIK